MNHEKDKSEFLYHITSIAEWEKAQAQNIYQPQRFSEEGFIHCSYLHQVIEVANRIFSNQNNLILLQIDCQKVESKIIDENLEGGKELYPHIYGLLPIDAVSDAIAFPSNSDGSFSLPAALKV